MSQFGAEVAQYFASLELQNLSELLEHRMKDAVFDVFVKPSDALLQVRACVSEVCVHDSCCVCVCVYGEGGVSYELK